MKAPILSLLVIAALAAAPANRKFTGVITDSMCATGDHSRMKMGADDAECTVACVLAHGALYVLFDGKQVYNLSDQQAPEKFAGKRVIVTGILDAKSRKIQVDSITASK